jgi:MFS family permease
MLTLGSICALGFLVVEWKFAAMPMMPLYLFRNKAVCVILIQNFLFGIVYYSHLYYLPIYYQNVRQYSPVLSAALTIPFVAGQSVFSILSGQYVSRIKRYGEVIWVGYALWTLGAGLVLTFDRTTPQWQMVIILFIEGAGVGNVFQPTLVAAQAHSPKQDRAVVTSIRNFMRSFGGSVGLALSSAIFANCLEGSLDSVTLSLPDNYVSEVLASILSTPNVSGLDPAQVAEVLDAYMEASKAVFYTWVPFIAVCLIMCILIKDKGLQRKEEKNATSESSTTENTIIGESGGELTAISNIGDVEKPKVGNYQRGDS